MPVVTLRDLYVDELNDLYAAERRILQELPGMAARATSGDLRTAFEQHYEATQIHLERLELLFRQLDVRPRQQESEALRGLVQQTHRRAADAERGEALDATLIAAAERIEHYEIAAYRSAQSYATTLGDAEAARILRQTLADEEEMDQRLREVANQGILSRASEDLVPHPTTYRSRLRYVAGSDLDNFSYGTYRIVTTPDEDDLGTIDGFIADGGTGRPVYYVVDSGGWFTGRRYVLPIAQLALDEGGGRLRTELTRDQLRRYPEFNPSAFIAMTDDEALRYERRLLATVLPFRHEPAIRRPGDRSAYVDLPLYQPPGWLMTGVWMTEGSGFASVPPRAGEMPGAPEPSSRRPVTHDDKTQDEHEGEAEMRPQRERVVAGDTAQPGEHARKKPADTRRIEKYPDR